MGLFNKKPRVEPAELEALRRELLELRERLDASEQAKVVLEDRLSSIGSTTMVMTHTSQAETAEIRERIDAIQHRVDATVAIGGKLDELHQRVIEVESRHPVVTDLPPPADVTVELSALSDRLEQVAHLADIAVRPDDLAARLEQLASEHQRELAERVSDLVSRVVATEQQAGEAHARASGVEERLAHVAAERADERAEERTAQLTARLDELQARVGELSSRDMQSEISGLHEMIDQIRSSLPSNDHVEHQFAELWRRVVATEDVIGTAHEQANTLGERIGDVDGRLGEITSWIGDIDTRVGQVVERNNQLDRVHERLSGTEEAVRHACQAAAALEQRLDHDDTRERLEHQLEELRSQLAAQADLPEQFAALHARVADLSDRGPEVERINERLEQLAASLPSTDGIHDEIERLAERVATSEGDARSARELAAAIEDRLGNIATELANQLSELSIELDQLSSREPAPTPGGALDETTVLELKSGQVKLANEQARYEITFREDLAALAEQVRQLRGRA